MAGTKKVYVSGTERSHVDSLIGQLVYKCGLDMTSLEALEKEGSRSYADIPGYFKGQSMRPQFYTKQNLCDVVDDPETADSVLLLIDVNSPTHDTIEFLQTWTSTSAVHDDSKLIVLVDKMEQINWSSDKYEIFQRALQSALQNEKLSHICFIPISTSEGGNLTESSEKFTNSMGGPKPQTVVDAIDA